MITIGPAAASTVWILRIFGLVMLGLSWFVVYQLYVTNDSWKDNIPLSIFACFMLVLVSVALLFVSWDINARR